MILHSQPLSEFVFIRANSWLIHSQWPETPNLSILPSLSTIQAPFTQNKPNSQNPKTTATPYATKRYNNNRPPSMHKNKPNQTQFTPPRLRAKSRRSRDRSKVPAHVGDAHRDPIPTTSGTRPWRASIFRRLSSVVRLLSSPLYCYFLLALIPTCL